MPARGRRDSPYRPQIDLSRVVSTYFGPVTVPPDAVFVLGDNPFESIRLASVRGDPAR